MTNMSYCRFENTYRDLADCEEAMMSGEVLSETEKEHRKKLIRLCIEIAKQYGPDRVAIALHALSGKDLEVR